jgi:hypothetical protein
MILKVHVPGAASYHVGDEIWQQPLEQAIAEEAETIADHAGSDLLESPGAEHRQQLRLQVIADMTRALSGAGASYRAPDGVLYSLIDEDDDPEPDTIPVAGLNAPPTVQEVVRFEELPLGSSGSRRAIVRWSDGSQGPALTWYADEIHILEADLLGKTAAELRTLHFRRDRDWLQS